MNKCDSSIPMKIFGSFFPSHYDVTEIRDLKTNVEKSMLKFGENCSACFLEKSSYCKTWSILLLNSQRNCSCYCVRQAIVTYLGYNLEK